MCSCSSSSPGTTAHAPQWLVCEWEAYHNAYGGCQQCVMIAGPVTANPRTCSVKPPTQLTPALCSNTATSISTSTTNTTNCWHHCVAKGVWHTLRDQRCLHEAAAICFCAGWWAGLTVRCMLVPTLSFTLQKAACLAENEQQNISAKPIR
jgi:hypothetical protein